MSLSVKYKLIEPRNQRPTNHLHFVIVRMLSVSTLGIYDFLKKQLIHSQTIDRACELKY